MLSSKENLRALEAAEKATIPVLLIALVTFEAFVTGAKIGSEGSQVLLAESS